MSGTRRVLVIDDNREIAEIVCATAEKLGMACTVGEDIAGFLKGLDDEPEVILLDLRMPEMSGIELLGVLGERRSKAKIVLMSGSGRREMEEARQLGAAAGLEMTEPLIKPFRLAELMKLLTS